MSILSEWEETSFEHTTGLGGTTAVASGNFLFLPYFLLASIALVADETGLATAGV